jgi:hypothetical protein
MSGGERKRGRGKGTGTTRVQEAGFRVQVLPRDREI